MFLGFRAQLGHRQLFFCFSSIGAKKSITPFLRGHVKATNILNDNLVFQF